MDFARRPAEGNPIGYPRRRRRMNYGATRRHPHGALVYSRRWLGGVIFLVGRFDSTGFQIPAGYLLQVARLYEAHQDSRVRVSGA